MQMTIRLKLMAGFLAVVAMLAVVAVIGIRGMQGIDQDLDELFEEDFKLVEAVDEVFIEALEAEVLLLEVAEAEDAAIQARHIEELNEQVILVEEHLADIGTQVRTDQERAFLARMEEDFLQFEAEIEEVEHLVEIGDHAGVSHVIETEVNVTFADLKIVIGEFIHELEVDAEAKKQHADESAASSTQLLIIISLAAAALAVLIGWLLSRSMSTNIGKAAKSADAIAQGDLSREVNITTSDEIGQLGESMRSMQVYLNEMAGYAESIADGDLTVSPKARSEKDVIGNAMVAMVTNLRSVVGQVQGSAASVGESSRQLAGNTDQGGQATQQIASAIQNVATGTATQTDALSQASKGVGQLSDASQSVAEGSQSQAQQIRDTQVTMERMVESIGQVAKNTESVIASSVSCERGRRGRRAHGGYDGDDQVDRHRCRSSDKRPRHEKRRDRQHRKCHQ